MHSRTLLAIVLSTVPLTPAMSYDWTGADLSPWTTPGNWNPSLGDPLNVTGTIQLVAADDQLNRCVLEASGQTATVSQTVHVIGDTDATFDNQRLFVQNATTLAAGDFLIVHERGMVIAEGGSILRAPDGMLVDGSSGSASLFLRDGHVETPLLESWGLLQPEMSSSFDHPDQTQNPPIQIDNLWPGTFNVECGANVTIDGNLYNEYVSAGQKAVVHVRDGATLTVTGSIDNDGIWVIGADCDPTQVAHLVLFGAAVMGVEAELSIAENGVATCSSFECATIDTRYVPAPGDGGTLDLASGEIQISSPIGGAIHTVELITEDLGPGVDLEADETTVIGTLRLGPTPAPIQMVDVHDNTNDGEPDAIYVRDLILEDGITLDLNGANIYYGSITPEDPYAAGSSVTIVGDGQLVQVSEPVVVGDAAWTPSGLVLIGASPNPFNPRTTVRFEAASARHATLRIFDTAGSYVRTLVDGAVTSGRHEVVWDGRDEAGLAVASGVYLYVIEGGGAREARRVTLLK